MGLNPPVDKNKDDVVISSETSHFAFESSNHKQFFPMSLAIKGDIVIILHTFYMQQQLLFYLSLLQLLRDF